MTLSDADPLRCEAAVRFGVFEQACDRKAKGEREMVCRSGYEIFPVLPACGYHLRRKRPPPMYEGPSI